MLIIHLHKLLFHSFHGLYEEEQVLGNEFEVNADIEVDIPEEIKNIQQTVNYVTIYNCIKKRMQQPTPLLETLAQDLITAIHKLDDRIKSVNINIKKTAAPIKNFQGIVGVSCKTKF
jgi:dihydroneopterin aldolase